MRYIADFHIHSKYSRATSRDCVPEMLELWARRKGLDLIGTGDLTHPAWRQMLKEMLEPAEEGLYVLKDTYRVDDRVLEASGGSKPFAAAVDSDALRPRFILSTEISSIYKKNGKTRKVHNVILLPSLEAAERLSLRLEQIGNLHSDGRPILGLDSRDLLEITLEICSEAIFIPAHIWTPHFSLFGAYSGFDRIEECFEDLTPYIHALETGLSSDPAMNWRLSALDGFTLVSNSDAHSPGKLAREANLFDTDLSFAAISHALSHPETEAFQGTLEFYPEEGKYHLDGHRNCKVCLKPSETIQAAGVCPVCGRRITVGVLHRVEDLADREEGFRPPGAKDFQSIMPLPETIAASLGLTAASKKVQSLYEAMLKELGAELEIIRQVPIEDVRRSGGPCVAEGIRRLRAGEIQWAPGYDGEYGKAVLLSAEEISEFSGQLHFFNVNAAPQAVKKRAAKAQAADVPPEEAMGREPQAAEHYGLNTEQWAAASASERAVAVIAGPGTGKTRTLVEHIRYLLEEQKVSPQCITAVTFTNKAAAEMRQRLQATLTDKRKAAKVHIGTFHSLCLELLTQWRGSVTLVDAAQGLAIAQEAGQALGLEQSAKAWQQAISRRKNGLPEKASWSEALLAKYQEQLTAAGALDFDDLLLETLAAFGGEIDTPKASTARKRFDYLLVDEFQDINAVQLQLLLAWSKDNQQLFVIGDPDQAIYGFRGADAQCFQKLAQALGQPREIRLTENYRSAPEIVSCALAVIDKLPSAGGQRQLKANRPAGRKVQLLTADSPFAEALYVAKAINQLVGGMDMLDAHQQHADPVREQPLGFSDIAVLYRTHRQAALLEECLQKEGIPYVVWGRDSFLEDAEVRQALAFFRHMLAPMDVISARQALTALGAERLAELENAWQEVKWAKEKPWKLVERWMAENDLTESSALTYLRNTALTHKTLAELLQNLALGQEGDIRRSGGKVYHSDAVTLSTLHGAKGLEFSAVFLCGVKKGSIPLQSVHSAADPDEERRLFYVGLTRAQEELVLLTSREEPSPFLDDIPEALLERGAVPSKPTQTYQQLDLF